MKQSTEFSCLFFSLQIIVTNLYFFVVTVRIPDHNAYKKDKKQRKTDPLTTKIALPVLFPWECVAGTFRASRGGGVRAREGYRADIT